MKPDEVPVARKSTALRAVAVTATSAKLWVVMNVPAKSIIAPLPRETVPEKAPPAVAVKCRFVVVAKSKF